MPPERGNIGPGARVYADGFEAKALIDEEEVCRACGNLESEAHNGHEFRPFTEEDLEHEIAFTLEGRVDLGEAYRLLAEFREAYKARGGRNEATNERQP